MICDTPAFCSFAPAATAGGSCSGDRPLLRLPTQEGVLIDQRHDAGQRSEVEEVAVRGASDAARPWCIGPHAREWPKVNQVPGARLWQHERAAGDHGNEDRKLEAHADVIEAAAVGRECDKLARARRRLRRSSAQ